MIQEANLKSGDLICLACACWHYKNKANLRLGLKPTVVQGDQDDSTPVPEVASGSLNPVIPVAPKMKPTFDFEEYFKNPVLPMENSSLIEPTRPNKTVYKYVFPPSSTKKRPELITEGLY